MSKHYTINVRLSETTDVEERQRTQPEQRRKVEELANVTVRAYSAEEALQKVALIIPAL